MTIFALAHEKTFAQILGDKCISGTTGVSVFMRPRKIVMCEKFFRVYNLGEVGMYSEDGRANPALLHPQLC